MCVFLSSFKTHTKMKPSTIPYSNEKRCTLYVTGILGFDERAVLSSYLCITDTNSTEAAILSGKCGVILLIVVSVDLQSAHNIIMRVCSLQYSGWCRRLFPVISLSLLWFLQFLILPLSLYTSSYNVPLFVYNFMISHWLAPSLALAPDATARKWLGQTKADVMHQLQVITIHLLSPFLYGCSHQTDKVSTYNIYCHHHYTNYHCSLHIATCVYTVEPLYSRHQWDRIVVYLLDRCPQGFMYCSWGKKRCPYWRVVLVYRVALERVSTVFHGHVKTYIDTCVK